MADERIVINDLNWLVYVHKQEDAGHLTGCLPRSIPFGELPCAPPGYDRIAVIPEAEWPDRIKAMNAAKAFPADHIRREPAMKPRSQNGLPYCWAYCFSACMDVLGLMQGRPYIETAAESLGGVVGYSQSGNDMSSTLDWAFKHGIAKRSLVPQYNLRPSTWDKGWEADALLRRPTEVYDLRNWAEVVSALLQGFVIYCGVTWWEHSLPWVGLLLDGSEIVAEVWNSHDDGFLTLKGSRKYPSPEYGIYAVRCETFVS